MKKYAVFILLICTMIFGSTSAFASYEGYVSKNPIVISAVSWKVNDKGDLIIQSLIANGSNKIISNLRDVYLRLVDADGIIVADVTWSNSDFKDIKVNPGTYQPYTFKVSSKDFNHSANLNSATFTFTKTYDFGKALVNPGTYWTVNGTQVKIGYQFQKSSQNDPDVAIADLVKSFGVGVGSASYDNKKKVLTTTLDSQKVVYTVGSSYIYVNGNKVKMTKVAYISDNKVFVPLSSLKPAFEVTYLRMISDGNDANLVLIDKIGA